MRVVSATLGMQPVDVAARRVVQAEHAGSSRSFITPAAVKLFVWDAARRRWRGVSASPVERSATPNAFSSTTRPLCAMARAQPGCPLSRIW